MTDDGNKLRPVKCHLAASPSVIAVQTSGSPAQVIVVWMNCSAELRRERFIWVTSDDLARALPHRCRCWSSCAHVVGRFVQLSAPHYISSSLCSVNRRDTFERTSRLIEMCIRVQWAKRERERKNHSGGEQVDPRRLVDASQSDKPYRTNGFLLIQLFSVEFIKPVSGEKVIDWNKNLGGLTKWSAWSDGVKLENVGELPQASVRVQCLLSPPLSYFLLGRTLARPGWVVNGQPGEITPAVTQSATLSGSIVLLTERKVRGHFFTFTLQSP